MSNKKLFNKYYYLGNREIINNYKVGFLCSRKVPAEKILKIYDWAIEQREKGVCVVSGFHSKIEKDVFHYLSKGKQPIIVVLARGMFLRLPDELRRLVADDKLLIITEFKKSIKRTNERTALKRNELILNLSQEVTIGYMEQKGLLIKLIKDKSSRENLNIRFI